MVQSQRAIPENQHSDVWRSREIIRLLDAITLDDNPTTINSDAVECSAFRNFSLIIDVDSTGAPTTVQFIVEFLNPDTSNWHVYKQGVFASLIYEDTDTATEIHEMFSGVVAGRSMRVRVVAVGSTSSATFKVSVSADFWS